MIDACHMSLAHNIYFPTQLTNALRTWQNKEDKNKTLYQKNPFF
jgi:hypothetical protein